MIKKMKYSNLNNRHHIKSRYPNTTDKINRMDNDNVGNHQSPKNRCYFSLACSIGSISAACGSLLQLNSISERITLQRGLFLTSMGFVYFISLTDFFNKYFLETKQGIRFRKKYHLMISDVMDITNKIVSAIQAAFSCLAGFIVCKSSCSRSFLYASHFVMEAYAWFGTAYFMYDIWSMYKVHTQKIADKLKLMNITTTNSLQSTSNALIETNENYLIKTNSSNEIYFDKKICDDGDSNDRGKMNQGNDEGHSSKIKNKNEIEKDIIPDPLKLKQNNDDENDEDYYEVVEIPKDGRWDFLKYVITHPVMMIHHVFIGTFGLLVVTYLRTGLGDCVYSFIYLMELSTPFVSLRSILSTIGLKNTQIYIVNGLIMLISFFICRILMWPYVFYWYSVAINRSFIQGIIGLPRGCKISILILFIPQIYWFSLMMKGAIKVFFTSKLNTKKDNEQQKDQTNIEQKLNTTNLQLCNNRPNNFTTQIFHDSTIRQNKKQMENVKSPNQSRTLL